MNNMLSPEKLKEISDVEKTLRDFDNLSMKESYFATRFSFNKIEILENLKELRKFLDESLDVTNRLSDSRVSNLVTNHRKYVERINAMIGTKIINQSEEFLEWTHTRLVREILLDILNQIPPNMRLILSILRLPEESVPLVFSLKFTSVEKQDSNDNLLTSELVSFENTSIINKYKEHEVIGGSTGPVFDFVTIVTLIAVAANVTKISETIWKYFKKEEKSPTQTKITIKTSTGEVTLSGLSSEEIEKILNSIKGNLNLEKI
jgi:hypothetical protein